MGKFKGCGAKMYRETKMKIGNVELINNVFLAPMAGLTDIPFRILCFEQGCGLAYTEMASAKGMHYDGEKSHKIVATSPLEGTVGIQIFGSDPAIMAGIADKLNESDAALIDINMGCPTPKIVNNGEGCALMKTPELAGRIIKEVVNVSRKPITVKFRKGWDDANVNAVDFAKMAEQAGASAVTIHGRTRAQYYSGIADWNIIREIKEAVKIPVIGNGDVNSAQAAKEIFEHTSCDAIMVGRGAQGNPWLFREILEFLSVGQLIQRPSKIEILDTIIRHFEMLTELKGERTGVREMRTHIAHYVNGMHDAAKFRNFVFKLEKKEEVILALTDFLRGKI